MQARGRVSADRSHRRQFFSRFIAADSAVEVLWLPSVNRRPGAACQKALTENDLVAGLSCMPRPLEWRSLVFLDFQESEVAGKCYRVNGGGGGGWMGMGWGMRCITLLLTSPRKHSPVFLKINKVRRTLIVCWVQARYFAK